MKKIIIAILALVLATLCFASCSTKTVEKIVEVPVEVEVEKIVEVPVEVEIPVEKTTTEINGIEVTGDYALKTNNDTIVITVNYVDLILNPEFNEELEEDELNTKYIYGDIVFTEVFEIGYTYKTLIFNGEIYLPAIPAEEENITLTGFYLVDGNAIYTTDADHTIAAAEKFVPIGIPTDTKDALIAAFEYVTFDFAD